MSEVKCPLPTLFCGLCLQRKQKGRQHPFRACAKAADQREKYGVGFKDYISISVSHILAENSYNFI